MQNIQGTDPDCSLPETLMIKESCNLTGQEQILVNHLKVYVINDKNTFFPENSINISL